MRSELLEVISQERNVIDGQDLCHSNWLIVYNNISQFAFRVNFPFNNGFLLFAASIQLQVYAKPDFHIASALALQTDAKRGMEINTLVLPNVSHAAGVHVHARSSILFYIADRWNMLPTATFFYLPNAFPFTLIFLYI